MDLINHTLTIGFRKCDSFHRERIEKRENKEFLQEQIKEILNCDLRIKTVFINGKPSAEGETTSKTTTLDMVLKVFPEAEIIKEG